MPVYKRPTSPYWWITFTANGVRYRFSSNLKNKRAAEQAEEIARQRATLGSSVTPAPEVTIGHAAASWWTHHGSTLRSSQTVAFRMATLSTVLDFDLPVSALTTRDVVDSVSKRRGHITHNSRHPTNASVNRDVVSTLRPIIRHALDVLDASPEKPIRWGAATLPEPKPRNRAFSADEMARYKAALPVWYHALVDFMALYGVRLGEAFFALDALDIDAGQFRLWNTKGGSSRTLPLLETDRRAMAARLGRAVDAKIGTVWFREMGAGIRPLTPRGFQNASAKAQAKAGLSDSRPAHDLRHHAATDALKRTGNLRAVQKLLGHTNITTTTRYVQADDADVRAALGHTDDTKIRNGVKTPIKTKRMSGT